MNHAIFGRPFITGQELRLGIDQFAGQVCSALSLPPVTVAWSDSCSTASINESGDITVRDVRDDARIDNATIQRYAGFICHELLHRKYTQFRSRVMIGSDNWQYRRRLHNAIEDAYIERRAIREGLLGNITGLLTSLLNGMVSDAKGVDWTDPAQYPFSLAVFAREYCDRVPVPANLIPIYAEASRRIDHAQSSADTLEIAEWVYHAIKIPPAQNQSGDDQSGDDQSGDDQSKDNQSGENQSGDDQSGDDQSGDDQPGDDQKDTPTAGQSKPIGKDAPALDVEPSAKPDPKSESAKGASWGISEVISADRHRWPGSVRTVSVKAPARLRFEVRKLFDQSATTLFSPNRKSGTVDPRALFKFGQTDRLFSQRREIDGIDSAVVIVLDLSGSMFGGRIDVAVNTCAALMDALASANVPTALVTFGDHVTLQLPFSEKQPRALPTLAALKDAGATNDYAAVRFAHDLLRGRREVRKVCFVLTDGDGEPAACKQQVVSGDAFGIRTIGIGIRADVSSVYPDTVNVTKLSDLDKVSFQQLKRLAA